MSPATQVIRPRSRQVELVTAADAPARRTRSRTTKVEDMSRYETARQQPSSSSNRPNASRISTLRLPPRGLASFSEPASSSSSSSRPAMPRTPPPAPSQDSIRDFVGYFSTLSTPHRNVGRGDTGGTSRLNQSAVSNSTSSTESTHSIDTASPSVSGTRRMRLRRRHSAASSDTSATLSVSTTAHTTTTAEEESRVERELTVAPVPAPRPGLRFRLRLRPPETRDCHTGHSTSPGSEKRQQQEEEDDDEEYIDGPKARTRYGKKRRTNRVDSPLEDVKPLEGKRKRRIRMASSVPGSRESTASLGSMAPRSE